MNLLCGALQSLWNNFYNTCVRNIDTRVKYSIGIALIVVSLLLFVFSTRGSKKGDMIGHWFLFWISMIVFIIGVIYLSI